MTIDKKIQKALAEVRQAFPFEGYIEESTYHELRTILTALRRFLPDFKGKSLLDIGCGPMDKTAGFQRMGFTCCAVDDLQDPWHTIDGNAEKIRTFAEREGIRFFHQKAGDMSIPFDENSFDVVTALGVVEHLHESPRGLLNAMGRYARPGGLLVVAMPNSVNLRKRLSVLWGRTNLPPVDMVYHSEGVWRGHIREYTLAEAVYICEENGFEIVHQQAFEFLAYGKLPAPALRLFLQLAKFFPTLQSGILVISRKPETWQPVTFDREAHNKAMLRGLPAGIG